MKTKFISKIFLILVLFVFSAQNILSSNNLTEFEFNTRYFKALDKWIVFPKKNNESEYLLGFIYLDAQAGFTIKYKGKVKVSYDIKDSQKVKLELIVKEELKKASLKMRLDPDTRRLAVLSDSQVKALKLPLKPKWLKIYKKNNKGAKYLKNIGHHLNESKLHEEALEYLLQAYKIKPNLKGLSLEIGYTYNALYKYQMAIDFLKKAIKKDKKNALLYRELGFSYAQLSNIKKADKVYSKGLKLSKRKTVKFEMAVNMLIISSDAGNKKMFDKWMKTARKYVDKKSKFVVELASLENDFKKYNISEKILITP